MNDKETPFLRAALAVLDSEPANDNRSPWERLADLLRFSDLIAWLRKDSAND